MRRCAWLKSHRIRARERPTRCPETLPFHRRPRSRPDAAPAAAILARDRPDVRRVRIPRRRHGAGTIRADDVGSQRRVFRRPRSRVRVDGDDRPAALVRRDHGGSPGVRAAGHPCVARSPDGAAWPAVHRRCWRHVEPAGGLLAVHSLHQQFGVAIFARTDRDRPRPRHPSGAGAADRSPDRQHRVLWLVVCER